MIPKQAIEKAIEGGWKPDYLDETFLTKNPKHAANILTLDIEILCRIALDPTFWQALGKALGWEGELWIMNGVNSGYTGAHWHPIAVRFLDLILTGGDTEKFWAELLNNHD